LHTATNTTFTKPTAQGRMIERVMLLDAVLDDREFTRLNNRRV
jgi:hypothetical protein